MLKDQIQSELVAAMRAKDAERLSTLRMLRAALQREEIELHTQEKELTDDAVLAIIRREVKQRNDAIEEYTKGGRMDLVEKEKKEKTLLESYLPAQLSDDDVFALVQQTITDVGAEGIKDFGKVMGAVTQKTKGQADGKRVSELVKKALTES